MIGGVDDKVTIKDIARRLGLAHTTVSRALNDHREISAKTKDRVRCAAREMGYVPSLAARMMRGEGARIAGLVVPMIHDEFYGTIATQFAEHCRRRDVRPFLAITGDDPAIELDEIRTLVESRAAGILIAPTALPLKRSLELLRGIATVQLVRHLPSLDVPAVCMAEAAGCAIATSRLLSLGHRRIAYIGTNQLISSGRERVSGYLDAHAQAGVAPMSDGLKLVPPLIEEGIWAVNELLSLPQRPTALLVGTSQLLVGCLNALKAASVEIPGDISVVSYGDAAWLPLISPPISAVKLDISALIENAFERLWCIMNAEAKRGESREILRIAPSFLERSSLTPPRK